MRRRACRSILWGQRASFACFWQHAVVLFLGAVTAATAAIVLPPTLVAAPEDTSSQIGERAVDRTDSDKSATKQEQGPQEIGPEIYYVPDKEGRLRAAVLNEITFEEFKKLLGNRAADRALPPQYVLSELNTSAVADEKTVDLKIRLVVKNLADADDQWIPVPLKMKKLIFSSEDPILYEGEGDHYLNYDSAREGYVLWIRGGGDRIHQIELSGKVLLQTVGKERQLRLRFPRATQSDCQLVIPEADQTVRVLSGGSLQQSEQVDGRTEARLEGIAGELRVAWRPTLVRNAPRMQALDVVGLQRIRMDGGLIRTEADLKIQSFAGPFDRFRVKLPPGSRLLADNSVEYSFQVNESDGLEVEGGEWVDVKLEQRTQGPVDIQLVTQQIRDLSRTEESTQLAGFDVEGSIRQSGRIDVFVAGDWHVRWQEDAKARFDIRRVDAPSDAPVPPEWVASFEYYRQPYSLNAQIEPPKTEIVVEPEFYFDVDKEQVVLEARFKYQVRGARIFNLDIDMRDWKILPGGVGPAERIDSEGLRTSTDGQLSIPFKRAAGGDFEIVVRAERPLPPGGALLTLPLPRSKAGRVDATVAIVSPADNVELVPRNREQLQERVPSGVKAKFDGRQQEPLFYLYDRGQEVPVDLSADLEIRQGEISSRINSRIKMTPEEVLVEQEIEFNIEYQRIDSIALLVPRVLLTEENLVFRDDKPLPLLVVDEDLPGDIIRVRVPLENAIGEVVLRVLHQRRSDTLEPGALTSVSIPLVVPAEGTLDENQLTLESADGIEMDPLGEQWERIDDSDAATVTPLDASAISYRCDKPLSEVDILAGLSEDSVSSQVVVRRGFLQSWLTPQSRYDRATLFLDNTGSFLDFEFPEDIMRSAIGVWLDRKRAEIRWLSGRQLRIALGSSATHVLEIEWQTPASSFVPDGMLWESRDLPMPRLSSNVQIQRPLYWQVVLPQMHHLLAGPEEAIPYNEWKWQRAGWRRIPLVGDRELSQWAGADALQNNFPGDTDGGNIGINRYLFRLAEWPSRLSVLTIPRTLLVLVPAGFVLAAGVACIYFPRLRRAEIAFVFAVGLLAVGLLYPEPAAMVVQMSLLGVILAVLAIFLRRVLLVRSPQRYVLERTGGSSHHQRTTEFHYLEHAPQTTSSVSKSVPDQSSKSIGSVEAAPLDGSVAEPNP
ncbi:MAG: hypothetical protein OSA43_00545 [Pirellulales bacterium]|nr:hypothetical protein [Pirellulales bacterium]